ncbi:MAG: hypothetical protein IPJ88_06210 [Myxococcales bacterium]|nr:MAG: hypothetical protein IPJ88_06210 [Myxococcales bacterium]
MKHMARFIQFTLIAVLLCTLSHSEANAAKRLHAKVFITQSKIPKDLNERKLIAFAQGHQAKRMKEQSDKPLPKRKWIGDMVVAFNAPPNELEYHALFFDVSGGGRRFVDDMATMISDRKQRTYLQKLKLRKPMFEPGKKYEVVITIRRAEVGKIQFETLGEREKRSGRVDFADEETK